MNTRVGTRHALLLASAFSAAMMLMPASSFAADPDDHPGVTHEKMENARDRFQDRKEDIHENKLGAKDRAQDRFQAKKENIRDRMSGAGEERREALRHHLTNVKDQYHDRRENIRDRAQDKRENARDRFQDRKEDLKGKDRDGDEPR